MRDYVLSSGLGGAGLRIVLGVRGAGLRIVLGVRRCGITYCVIVLGARG